MGAILMVIGALVVAVIGLGIVMALFGMVFGLAVGLLALSLKLLPLVLVGWVIVKLVQSSQRHRALSSSDRRWLDSNY